MTFTTLPLTRTAMVGTSPQNSALLRQQQNNNLQATLVNAKGGKKRSKKGGLITIPTISVPYHQTLGGQLTIGNQVANTTGTIAQGQSNGTNDNLVGTPALIKGGMKRRKTRKSMKRGKTRKSMKSRKTKKTRKR